MWRAGTAPGGLGLAEMRTDILIHNTTILALCTQLVHAEAFYRRVNKDMSNVE
jgi:hypothetical protein